MIDTNHLLQSDLWREIKENGGYEIIELDNYFGTVSVVPFFKFRVGYIPRIKIDSSTIDSIIELGKEKNLSFIKIDPINLEEPEIDKSNINYSTAVQLQSTRVIDTSINREEYFESLKRKDRYYYRKAEKDGLKTEIKNDLESFEKFAALYDSTMKRHKAAPRGYKYLKNVFDIASKKNAAYIISTSLKNDLLVSSLVLVHDSVVYYLYTGSDYRFQKYRGSFFHVVNALKWANESNYKYFDLFGIEEDKGFSEFKMKFPGENISYAKTFDVIINKTQYNLINVLDRVRKFINKIK